jgi:thymidylate synthase (FAD)
MLNHKYVDGGRVELLNIMGDELTIVNAARASFGKRKDLFDKKDEKLLKYLWTHRHTTPFEKVTLLFHVECALPVRSQWFRHRTWSFNELSRRYTSEDITIVIPTPLRLQDDSNKQSSHGSLEYKQNKWAEETFERSYQRALEEFHRLLDLGVCREQARYILPQGARTEFYAKVDLKNLMDFLMARMASDAQYEIRVFADAIFELLEERLPICMGLLKSGRWQWIGINGESSE